MVELYTRAPLRPINRLIATYGDSRLANGWSHSSTETINAVGMQHWATVLSNGRVEFRPEDDFAVSGETVAQIKARIADVVASDAGSIVFLGGTNSVSGGVSAAAIIADYIEILDTLEAAGKYVFMFAEVPRGGSNPLASDALRGVLQQISDWVRYVAARRNGVSVVDAWPTLVDPASMTGDPIPGLFRDGLHFGASGAYLAGAALAEQINGVVSPNPGLIKTANSIWSATDNPYGCLNANPTMLGTGGTVNATASGSAADSYQITGQTSTGLTIVGSKATLNGDAYQRLAVSGTGSSTNPEAVIEQFSGLAAKVSAGDVLQLQALVDVAASANLKAVYLELQIKNAGATVISARTGYRDTGANYGPTVAYRGVMRTPTVTVPSTFDEVRMRAVGAGYNGAAVTLDFGVTAMNLIKVRP